MTLISEYLAADLSADASADALCIIDIGKFRTVLMWSTSRKLSQYKIISYKLVKVGKYK